MNSTSSISPAFAKAPQTKSSLRPWQFYMTASFLAAAAAVWLSPPSTPVAMVLISLAIGAAGACATALHALLASFTGTRVTEVRVTESERAALEREKLLALRAIKELHFDMAMGKISAADAAPMEARLRQRAADIISALDSREHLRARVEDEIARRQAPDSRLQAPGKAPGPESGVRSLEPFVCAACATANDVDARFCKGCGAKL